VARQQVPGGARLDRETQVRTDRELEAGGRRSPPVGRAPPPAERAAAPAGPPPPRHCRACQTISA